MSNLSQSIVQLKSLVFQYETELTSLQAGRKASAARARKFLQQIKTLAHKMRGDIMIYTRDLPTKSRSVKITDIELEPPPILERERALRCLNPYLNLNQ